ncbi:alpha/beta fold hydrolase [Neolewinella antarctica]|uniref:Pimeloyl-ACP methyl ester carboxylesterase n=1 Tax=Neolewinella antarctica TaxID=442734 RepID=A0ABX0XBS9_9BACT|nr:alpha/beta hydrolase [Neolewinella antarctica]NJC26404.1 pimeloyl-ACP methyl ester carboxylesterase [Neolewinella antarctica]
MFRKKRHFAYLVLVPLVVFLIYAGYRVYPYYKNQPTDADLIHSFTDLSADDITLGYVEGTSRDLRYLEIGSQPDKPLLVFIHGSPSSSVFWVKMMQDSALLSRANLLAIDRPGYGGSGLGNAMTSVSEQAENVVEVIREKMSGPDQPVIIHGSSYGGTVSARIAMDFPDIVDGLLLQSASMAPNEEYVYWLSHPTSHWLIRWALPAGIRTANQEKLNHQQQLEDMVDEWDNIDASTVIIHGTDDWLIYPRNAYFACGRLTNASKLIHHMVDGGQHDLIYRTPDLIKAYLNELLDDVATGRAPDLDADDKEN